MKACEMQEILRQRMVNETRLERRIGGDKNQRKVFCALMNLGESIWMEFRILLGWLKGKENRK